MKTTIEIPDALLRQARIVAIKRDLSLKQLVIDALKRIIADIPSSSDQPEWRRCFGAFHDSPSETAAIQKVVDTDFSGVDPEEWK